ncbi:hypothetical protein EGW08_020654 [Elysia chlorotica]|uniref:Chitin-binding type-2 domain-containing protein n=1 Tax=Elysia chlorotica TaxID=188477 RepID=A0A433SQR8_ELYCH|nr:hypothetical protein EGW08_020654 [Elysia chlorotica]
MITRKKPASQNISAGRQSSPVMAAPPRLLALLFLLLPLLCRGANAGAAMNGVYSAAYNPWGAAQGYSWGMAAQGHLWGSGQGQPWGMSHMRQRMNLENGICSRPLVIIVCVEGSMAKGRSEFRQMLDFAGRVVTSLGNLQPRHLSMAINYCSYVKDWTPWTSSQQAFVRSLEDLQWPYHFRPSPVSPYGGYPGTGGLGYGGFSPLQPNSGLCLEKARQALAQVPPYYQRLILHFTSGHSSNPLERYVVRSNGLSEELRMSVSGYPYLLQVSSLASLSRRHMDEIIQNICRVVGSPSNQEESSNAQTDGATVDGAGNVNDGASGGVGGSGTSGGVGGSGTSGGVGGSGTSGGVGGSGTSGGVGGSGTSGGVGGSGTSGGVGGSETSGGVGGSGTSGGVGGSGTSGGVGGSGTSGGVGGSGTSGGVGGSGTSGGVGGSGTSGGVGGSGTSGGVGGSGTSGGVGGSGTSGGVGGSGTSGGVGGSGTSGGVGGSGTSGGVGGGGGGTGGGTGAGNNNNGGFQLPGGSQSLCVPVGFISNPFLRQLYLGGRRPCPIVTMRPLPTVAAAPCLDLSSVKNSLARQAMLLVNYPRKACPESANPVTTATTVTAAPGNQQCVDLSGIPEEYHEAVLILSAPLEACSNSTNSSSSSSSSTSVVTAEITNTAVPVTVTVSSSPVVETTQATPTACVDISFFPEEEQAGAVIFLSIYNITACPASNTSRGNSSVTCFDLSGFPEDQRVIIVQIIYPTPPCNESITTVAPGPGDPTPCVNVSSVALSDQRIAFKFLEHRSLVPCTPAEVPTTPGASLACIDVSIFPLEERPGAGIFLSLYGIQACPLTNSSSGAGGSNSPDCVDISGFSQDQKDIIIEIIKPSLPCNETPPTNTPPVIGNITLPCVNVTSENVTENEMSVKFMMSRGLLPCGFVPTTVPAPTDKSCVNISIYTNPEDRAKAIEFFELYNITICPEESYTDAVTTGPTETVLSPCIDVSIFPQGEQPGAVVFLSLYGIRACPLTDSSSGAGGTTNSGGCVDISGFTDEQKAVIKEIIKPSTACNENPGSTTKTPNSGSGKVLLGCVNITAVNDTDRDIALEFVVSRGLSLCDGLSAPTLAPTKGSCVDISIYKTPEDRAKAIEFFEYYNITICAEVSTTEVLSTESPVVAPPAFFDVSIFPVPEQAGAVVFLSLYGIQACSIENCYSETGNTKAEGCINLSGYSEEQKTIILSIVNSTDLCDESLGSATVSPGTESPRDQCVDISNIDHFKVPMINTFMASHSYRVCGDTNPPVITSPSSATANCADISVYTHPKDIEKVIAFLELYNITICPEYTTTEVATTVPPVTSPAPCIDVSIFPMDEQPGAVVFLSLYGIRACPLTNSSSAGDSASSDECVDISRFTEEQKAVIVEIIKPALPCNETVISTTVSPDVVSVEKPCVNISSVNGIAQQMAGGFVFSRGLVPCEDVSSAAKEGCVDVDIYTDPNDRAKAIEFFELYNITICPEVTPTGTVNTESSGTSSQPCIDVSIFPLDEQPGAFIFLSLYGILACPLGTSNSQSSRANSTDCVDVSGFTTEQKSIIVEIIKPRAACNGTFDQVNTNVSSSSGSAESLCLKLNFSDEAEKEMVSKFLAAHGLSLCGSSVSVSTSATPTVPSVSPVACTDISGYTDPVERARAVEFFTLYNITICTVVSPTPTPQSDAFTAGGDISATSSLPCVDITIFPEEERIAAVVFLSLYGILVCPVDSADDGTASGNVIDCVVVSGFSSQQKAAIREVVKPTLICNDTAHSSQSSSTDVDQTGTTTSDASVEFCFNTSAVEESKLLVIKDFILSRGLNVCQADADSLITTEATRSEGSVNTTSDCVSVKGYSDPAERASAIQFFNLYNIRICDDGFVTSTATGTPTQDSSGSQTQGGLSGLPTETSGCIDLSGYTDSAEKAKARAFFELYNYTICPESTPLTTSFTATTPSASEPCLDVSIFPENERANAVVFLSIYGILACPLTNSTSASKNCIDLSGFTEVRRAILVDLIKPAEPCKETSSPSPPFQPDPTVSGPSGSENGGSGSALTLAADTGQNGQDSVTTTAAPCVNLSSYAVEERPAAIAFFQQYGISPCEDVTAPTTTRSCVDLSGVVPALRAFVLALNAPLEACDGDQERCSPGQASDLPILPDCVQYLSCDATGALSRQCCPTGQVFSDGSCQTGANSGCSDLCV